LCSVNLSMCSGQRILGEHLAIPTSPSPSLTHRKAAIEGGRPGFVCGEVIPTIFDSPGIADISLKLTLSEGSVAQVRWRRAQFSWAVAGSSSGLVNGSRKDDHASVRSMGTAARYLRRFRTHRRNCCVAAVVLAS